MRYRLGVVVGMPSYARYLARLINEHSTAWRLRAYEDGPRVGTIRAALATRGCDALISFGGPAPNVALLEVARECGVPVIVIWAGTDVMSAAEQPALLQTVRVHGLTHISDSPWLIDELRVLGIDAKYVPVTAIGEGPPIRPFPQKFTVLTYLPEPRRDFYGRETVYAAARALPETPFVVVGRGRHDPSAPPNVRFAGQVPDATPFLDAGTVLLRVPEHDGKSMFVLEALGRGRHVIWNHKFPHCDYANDVETVIDRLERLRARHAAGQLQLNYDGRAYALNHFSRSIIAGGFENVLNAAPPPARRSAAHASVRVAVSGLPLFCAQVAQAVASYAPGCEVHVIHTDTRLQVLTALHTLIKSDVWYSIGAPRQDRLLRIVAGILKKPQILHWVGSDILHLEDRRLRDRLKSPLYTHLAEVDWTQQELFGSGIEAGVAPLPVRYGVSHRPPPLPARFTVLLYIPQHRAECYGIGEYGRLMLDLRPDDVKYLVVGGGHISVPEGVDCENLGWREDLRDAYERSTVLLRFTPRDGLSLMALEALSFGRYVIWTQPFPHAVQVRTYRELRRAVRDLLERHQRGELNVNEVAREHVRAEYDAACTTRKLADIWVNAAGAAAGRPTGSPPSLLSETRGAAPEQPQNVRRPWG